MLRPVTSDRTVRSLLCRFLIGVVLCAQWAVAAHACPGAPAMTAARTMQAAAAMADCDEMIAAPDSGASNLCAEHCRQGQQSDAVPAITVPAAVLATLYPLPAPGAVLLTRAERLAAPADALGPAPPPHEIAHCCFRI